MPVSGPTYKQVTGSPTSGGPSVTGTTSSTDSAIVLWDGTGGSDLKNSGVLIDGSNNITTPGTLGIGGTASSSAILNVGVSNPLTGTSQFGIQVPSTFVVNSNCTINAYGVISRLGVQDATFTLPTYALFVASPVAKGAGATVSRAVGLYCAGAMTAVGAQSSAIISDNISFTGDYTLNFATTNPSLFSGRVGIGATGGSYMLRIAGTNLTSGVNQIGISVENFASSGATGAIYGVSSGVTTAAASYTCAFQSQFVASNPVKGAGSTITRQVGYFVSPPTQGDNNAAITDNGSFTGNWVLNFSSTNPSYFAGTMGIGGANNTSAVLNVGTTNPLTGTSQIGVWSNIVATSAATNGIGAMRLDVSTVDAAFTSPILVGLNINTVTKGASATITRAMGMYVATPTVGSTGNCTIGDNVTFTGSWFINSSSTNPSYFAGPLRYNSTTTLTGDVEGLTVAQVYSGTTTHHHNAATLRLRVLTNDALSATQIGTALLYRREVTADVTDTSTGGIARNTNVHILSVISADGGHTYTYNDGDGFSDLSIASLGIGAGTTAIAQYRKLNILACSSAITGTKYGCYIGAQSGATNNWAIYTAGSEAVRLGGVLTVNGPRIDHNNTASGARVDIITQNNANTAGSEAVHWLVLGGTSATNVYTCWGAGANADSWLCGVRMNDGQSFRIEKGRSMGSANGPAMRFDGSSERITIKSGAATTGNVATVGGNIVSKSTAGQNTGTGETDINTGTLKANSLSASGDMLIYKFSAFCQNNANAKTIRLYFGSTVVATFGFTTSVTEEIWGEAVVSRTGASQQRTATMMIKSGAPGSAYTSGSVATVDETIDNTVKITAQGGATGDITVRFYKVDWSPAA